MSWKSFGDTICARVSFYVGCSLTHQPVTPILPPTSTFPLEYGGWAAYLETNPRLSSYLLGYDQARTANWWWILEIEKWNELLVRMAFDLIPLVSYISVVGTNLLVAASAVYLYQSHKRQKRKKKKTLKKMVTENPRHHESKKV